MYQVIAVDDWKAVDVYEVIRALPKDSKILLAYPSEDAFEIEADEPPKNRKS